MGLPGCRVEAARESRGGVMMGGEVFQTWIFFDGNTGLVRGFF